MMIIVTMVVIKSHRLSCDDDVSYITRKSGSINGAKNYGNTTVEENVVNTDFMAVIGYDSEIHHLLPNEIPLPHHLERKSTSADRI